MKQNIISKKGKIIEFTVALVLILMGIGLRLLPHSPNFSPIAAMALFGGVYFSKKIALAIPLAAMVISDVFIGYYEASLMVSVYGSFLLCVFLGFWLKKNKKWQNVIVGSISGSVIFFALTNFSVWAFTLWYDKTLSGLGQCFLMALPFFKNTLLGDLVYVAIFFGLYELAEALIKRRFVLKEASSVLSN